ncbi:hypothetical protein V1264_005174 [Littorina saxatilis]|uniref:Nuclease HARBI1 n=1 Tax=Littorina saxatilis TaxID=31220 RepID=A0AAN9G5U1_9CAEN
MTAFMMLEYAERRNLRRNRIFRDRIHPVDKYDDVDLYRKFRFRRQDIMDLTDEVADDVLLTSRRGARLPSLQVCLALRFFACGTFQDVCAELIGVSQPTASRTITRVTNAFLRHCPEWIRIPTLEEARRTKDTIFLPAQLAKCVWIYRLHACSHSGTNSQRI